MPKCGRCMRRQPHFPKATSAALFPTSMNAVLLPFHSRLALTSDPCIPCIADMQWPSLRGPNRAATCVGLDPPRLKERARHGTHRHFAHAARRLSLRTRRHERSDRCQRLEKRTRDPARARPPVAGRTRRYRPSAGRHRKHRTSPLRLEHVKGAALTKRGPICATGQERTGPAPEYLIARGKRCFCRDRQ